MNARLTLVLTLLCGSAANAQVVINEVQENPSGGGIDPFYEYIELYGKPGTSLDGYILALLKGGAADPVEIDESYDLTGNALGANGVFILYNDTEGGTLLPPFDPDSSASTFTDTWIDAANDTPGNLANDDSSTYVLLRGRPVEVTGPFLTDWRKDISFDINSDSMVDFPFVAGAFNLEPYQMVDNIAFSNNMGMEYTREDQDELNDTPGFNPDALTRLEYFGDAGPGPGVRAEEEWVRGEMNNLTTFTYVPVDSGFPAAANPAGAALTPGALNDYFMTQQFRFVDGDLTFDGQVDLDDLMVGMSLLGATLDDRTDCLDEFGAEIIDPNTSEPYQCFVYQGRMFNALEALRCLNTNDDATGGNAAEVTQGDLDALAGLVGDVPCSAADFAEPFGVIDFNDVIAFLTAFGAMDSASDLAPPMGILDFNDVIAFLTVFGEGCP